MSDEERFIQWLLATGGDPNAPGADPQWHQRLRQDPRWQRLAEEIRDWDRQLGDHLRQGEIPACSRVPELRERLLAWSAAEAPRSEPPISQSDAVAPGNGSPSASPRCAAARVSGTKTDFRSAWKIFALVTALAAVVLLWWLWPSAGERLARSAWQAVQVPEFSHPEPWYTHRQPDPRDDVPPVVRVSRRLRWRPIQLGDRVGVVHHLMNHEAQSVQAWLFVLQGVWTTLPKYPPKQPQWQHAQATVGCWADVQKQRTYVLVVPGPLRQYRFWTTAGPLARNSPATSPAKRFPAHRMEKPAIVHPGNRPF